MAAVDIKPVGSHPIVPAAGVLPHSFAWFSLIARRVTGALLTSVACCSCSASASPFSRTNNNHTSRQQRRRFSTLPPFGDLDDICIQENAGSFWFPASRFAARRALSYTERDPARGATNLFMASLRFRGERMRKKESHRRHRCVENSGRRLRVSSNVVY